MGTFNETETSLKYGPESYLKISGPITSVSVQTDDLRRLERHLNKISILSFTIDWNSLLLGAFFSSLISLIYQWFTDKAFPAVYAVLAIGFLGASYLVYQSRVKKANLSEVNHLVDEAKADLNDILDKAKMEKETTLS